MCGHIFQLLTSEHNTTYFFITFSTEKCTPKKQTKTKRKKYRKRVDKKINFVTW